MFVFFKFRKKRLFLDSSSDQVYIFHSILVFFSIYSFPFLLELFYVCNCLKSFFAFMMPCSAVLRFPRSTGATNT